MGLIVWWFALAVAITAGPAKAQEQKTLGPCSPAIAGVIGNVSVTCVAVDRRIRIAQFDGNVDADRCLKFATFVSNNFGQIIHLDAYSEMSRKLYDRGLGALTCQSVPHCRDTYCPYATDVYFNELNKRSTAYFAHGDWRFQGYYIVGCGGFAQGVVEFCLRSIDDKKILLSDKYDTR
jgi:hypothetical protein